MVFILRREKTGVTAVLGENIDYTLGRSRFNKILLEDRTCKKKHAKIIIKNGIATIKVLSPRGAVFINEHQIYNEKELEPGDTIVFGQNNCRYSFNNPNFQVFLDDSVTGDEKDDLCMVLRELNVNILSNYSDDCTHFVIPTLTLDKLKNSEILKHFLNKKDIVTPKFWMDMLRNISEAAEIPNIYRCMPGLEQPLIEQGVEVVRCKNRTKTIFNGIPVVFFNEILERNLEHIIMECGGLTFLHDSNVTLVSTLSKVMKYNIALVVRPKEEELSPNIEHFINELQETDKKVYELSEDDILIAVLKGRLKGIENNKTLDFQIIPNLLENSNDVIVLNDDLHEDTTRNEGRVEESRRKNSILKGWVTPTKKKKTNIETRDKPSTSRQMSNETKKQKTTTKEKQEELNLSLKISSDSDSELDEPGKQIEDVQKKTKKDFRSLSMSSDSNSKNSLNGDDCENTRNGQNIEKNTEKRHDDSDLTELPIKNTSNIQNKEELPKKRCDKESEQKRSSKKLKINPLAKLKETNEKEQKDSSINIISSLNKMYKDVEFEPYDD